MNILRTTLLTAALVATASLTSAQEIAAPLKQVNVSSNPLNYFMGNFNASVQYAISRHFALGLTPSYTYAYYFDPAVHGFGGRASVTGYFTKVYDGFHLDAGLSYFRLTQRTGGRRYDANVFYPDFLASWAWLWDNGVNAFVGVGMGYFFGNGDQFTNESFDFDGVGLSGKLGVGYAF